MAAELDIVIVGMSCRFAACPTPAALWEAVMARRNLLTVPAGEVALPFGSRNFFDRPYPVRLGQLGELYACVPAMQTFPRQVNAGENQDLYFATQLAFDALLDASLRPHGTERLRGTVRLGYATPFNAANVNWLQHTVFLGQTLDIIRRFFPHAPEDALEQVREKLVESLPFPEAASFLVGSGYRFASWIARECSFDGAATVMDAGMLTGAATLAAAADDLRFHRADVALAGVFTPPFSRAYLEGISGEVTFSERSALNPYALDSDGTIPGEGGAFFVLKRREDALHDRDRIYARVRSVAIGRNAGDDPSRVFVEAAERAEMPISTIGLVEGDGAGIAVAEAREIASIQRLFGPHRPGGPLVGLGSVKGNIGHTLHAAMAAGLVKAALALNARVLPPSLAAERSVAALDDPESSVYLLSEARPWITGDSSRPRRAAVLGANFDSHDHGGRMDPGGRAAVILLEEEPEERQ